MLKKTVLFSLKSNTLRKSLILVFLSFLTQSSFAINHQDIHRKLDDLVLRENIFNKLTRTTRLGYKKNTMEGSIQTRFDLSNEEKVDVRVSWVKESYLDLVLGIGTFSSLPGSDISAVFNLEASTLTKIYNYHNKLGAIIPMAFTITTDAIKRITPDAIVLKEDDGDSSAAAVVASDDVEALSSATVDHAATPSAAEIAHVSSTILTIHSVTSRVDTAMSSFIEAAGDCVATSEHHPVDTDSTTGKIAKFENVVRKLEFLSHFSNSIIKLSGELDHVYTALYFGADGLLNLADGIMSLNPFRTFHGASQIAVAGMSGKRVYEGYTEDTEHLLSEISDSADQIRDLSTATQGLVDTISRSLDGVSVKLSLVDSELKVAQEILAKSSIDQSTDLAQVVAKYKEAEEEGRFANSAFAEFTKNNIKIIEGWKEIEDHIKELEENFRKKIGNARELGTYLKKLEDLVLTVRELFNSLSDNFNCQAIISERVNHHRNRQDRLTSEAGQLLLGIIEKNAATNRDLKSALSMTRSKLQDADLLLKSQEEELAKCRQQTQAVAEISKKIQEDAEKVERKVAEMFTTKELAVVAGVAILCPGGPLIKSFAALMTCRVIKKVAHKV